MDTIARGMASENAELISTIGQKISRPSGFSWADSPVEGKVTKLANGQYVTSLNTRQFDIKGVEYFVDQSSGSNANDGLTPATALATMLAAYNKPDVGTITMLSTASYYANSMNGQAIDKSISIKGFAGAKCMINNAGYAAWTKTGGYTSVYQKTVTGATAVIDRLRYLDGDFFPLKSVASLAECDATEDSYYITGATVYAHVLGGGSPSTAFYTLRSDVPALTIALTGGKTVYLENLDIVGGLSISGEGTVVAKNCTFQYGRCTTGQAGNSAYISGNQILTIFDKCVASRAKNDGFCYVTGAKSIEINCTGKNNGDESVETQNGSTSHGGSKIIRISGNYYKNHGPNVGDVQDGTESWNLGCLAHDSLATGDSIDFATNSEGAAKIFLEGCVGYGSTISLYIYPSTSAYLKDCEFRSITNSGTITRY